MPAHIVYIDNCVSIGLLEAAFVCRKNDSALGPANVSDLCKPEDFFHTLLYGNGLSGFICVDDQPHTSDP